MNTHILRDEPRDKHKRRLNPRQDPHVAEPIPIRHPRREAQVLGPAVIQAAHDAPRDPPVDAVEEGLPAAEDLCGRGVVELGGAVGGGGAGVVEEVLWCCSLEG